MVITANDMGNPHVMIINDDGQHVGWRAIGAQDHHVVKRLVLHRDPALHGVINCRLAAVRHLHAYDKGAVGRVTAVPPW